MTPQSVFTTCVSCDRGQRCCCPGCREEVRRRQRHEANCRYQEATRAERPIADASGANGSGRNRSPNRSGCHSDHFAPTFAADDHLPIVPSAVRIAPGSIHFRASRADGGAAGAKKTFLHDLTSATVARHRGLYTSPAGQPIHSPSVVIAHRSSPLRTDGRAGAGFFRYRIDLLLQLLPNSRLVFLFHFVLQQEEARKARP